VPEEDRQFYFEAFKQLSTTRQIGFSTGPIPWTTMIMYADHSQLDDANRALFVRVISEMDAAYLAWLAEEQKRDATTGKAAASG
jgi:hypothetical protein